MHKREGKSMSEMSFEELQEIVSICLDEIVKLKEENQKLSEDLQTVSGTLKVLLDGEAQIVRNVGDLSSQQVKVVEIVERSLNNLPYENADPRGDREYRVPSFHQMQYTIDKIVEERCSIARFGDGEFSIMSLEERQKFQNVDEDLAKRLLEVLHSHEDGLLIGIADNYGDLSPYNNDGKRGIRYYMTEEVRREHDRFLEYDRTYHNAYISRPYALFADNKTDAPRKRFDQLRRIWEGRDVIFVEGTLTRMGVGNDLFDNAKSIRRILGPATNAYGKYEEILAACEKYGDEDTLFLIALGPTAGVLAHDLYKKGYQAVDIGHVDLEYEWMKNGTGARSEVKTKYNNEYPDGYIVEDVHDEEYERQVVAVIC